MQIICKLDKDKLFLQSNFIINDKNFSILFDMEILSDIY